MSGRIRLLTFDALPSPCSPDRSSASDEVLQRLNADSVLFENHYLQRAGVQSVAGLTARFPGGAELESRFRAGEWRAQAYFSLPEVGSQVSPSELPGWLSPVVARWTAADQCALPTGPQRQALCTAEFSWLHFGLTIDNTNQAVVERLIGLMTELNDDANAVTLITALNGTQPDETGTLESLLWESQIRTPLWLRQPGRAAARVQTITGSDDVAFTVDRVLSAESVPLGPWQVDGDGPASLIDIASHPARSLDRLIRVRHANTTALRSEGFLFVQRRLDTDSDVTAGQHCSEALYVKPADTWNVNDVSVEYPDVVDELRQRLN